MFMRFLLTSVHYLTDKEQKISCHSFLRHSVVVVVVVTCNSIVVTVCTWTYASEKRRIVVV